MTHMAGHSDPNTPFLCGSPIEFELISLGVGPSRTLDMEQYIELRWLVRSIISGNYL